MKPSLKAALKAVKAARELGADTSEELNAFREARDTARLVDVELDLFFAAKGWN